MHASVAAKETKNRKPKTVVLWGRDGLLVSGFEKYLNTHVDWEVIRIKDPVGNAALVQIIEAVKPDVVLIDDDSRREGCAEDTHLPALLFHAHPGITVITFNLASNLAEIYSKQQVVVTEITDLLEIIGRHSTSQEKNHG